MLSEIEIEAYLEAIPGWERIGDSITRVYGLRPHGYVPLVVHIVDVEQRVGHHADIDLRRDHVRFTITTHAAGGKLTIADFDLARRIERVAALHETKQW
ncbi:4a-hydroxytetrahydrobiopterin dehydratase [Streptomyces sp. MZ04]|uniref:4a-hydroxytetrahydrobiopterin dehydratase n=1 Tax=Streptomyces sp. MZ04 TaxID=2559236 RepID=UPI00107E799E|nr:4a-hydroxytetrahydrobiopterin dehydratase [Streptomyces sp. MZ04]TGB08253.1 4a-hydroxytetrahydrobiopterin dehydratase [Streptomyces sp. MZ04]